jgi:hypothetical protein
LAQRAVVLRPERQSGLLVRVWLVQFFEVQQQDRRQVQLGDAAQQERLGLGL